MTELALLALVVGHYCYEAAAILLEADSARVFYIFQGATGLGFFVLAGLSVPRHWAPAVRWPLYLVALTGVAEQTLVAACGAVRLHAPIFRAPPGEGLCGPGWYGAGLAITAWVVLLVYVSRRANP